LNADLAKFWKRVSDSTGVPLEGLSFIYDACDFTQQSREHETGGIERRLRHFSAAEFCQSFVRLAQEKFGDESIAALRSWHLDSSEKLGRVIYRLIDHNIMQRRDGDAQSDFGGQFDFSGEIGSGSTEAVHSYSLAGLPDYRHLQPTTAMEWVFRTVVFGTWSIGVAALAVWAAVYLDPVPVPVIVAAIVIVSSIVLSRLRHSVQYSVRMLLITTTVVALILGIVVVMSR
jgi:uncharacterized repeat protein (TIGR04138 family)